MSNIKVGDLVMVVRKAMCGCCTFTLGYTFTVTKITNNNSRCGKCEKSFGIGNIAWDIDNPCDFYRLMKIDPPALPKSITEQKELTV